LVTLACGSNRRSDWRACTDARRQIEISETISVLHIRPAPDAGRLKTAESERSIPVHSALVKEGFLDFVRSVGQGPLFYGHSSGDPNKKHASKSKTKLNRPGFVGGPNS